MMRTSNLFPLARRYSKQKARSRVQSTTNGGKLLTGLFLFCCGYSRGKKEKCDVSIFLSCTHKKIERGLNYPAYETLEKIMDVLGVTPNELLSGEWKYIDHTEPYIMDVIKREQDFNVSLDYLSENEFFNDERECRFYMEYKLIQYIHNYITNEVTELEELMEIKQLIQRQKLERMMKVHKEMRGLDRYREQPKEYKYHDPYDDWIFRQLADIDNRNNIPDTSPQSDFNEADYDDYLKEKWNRGL